MAAVPDAIKQGKTSTGVRAASRLASLDAFRGFTMLWIIGGGALMGGLQALGHNPVLDTIVYHLNHSEWQGLRYYDLIWPSFMLMVGAAIPFARTKHSPIESRHNLHLRALRRAAILFLLGSLRTSISTNTPTLVELSSALQPIAVAYLSAHFLSFTAPKVQAAAGAAIFAGYALLLEFVPAPGIQAGSYVKDLNLVTAVDLALLGRAHQGGWGTVLSTIPTIATTIAGLLVGELLISSAPHRKKIAILGIAGVAGVILGSVLGLWIPVIMKLWTASYGILATGWACLLFLLFYWTIDIRNFRKPAFPLAVIGMNALAIYMGKSIVPLSRIIGIFTGSLDAQLGTFTPLVHAIAVLAVEWLILYWMFKRRIFLRA